MTAANYAQNFLDHSYLWKKYAPADDLTGAYVDQDDLEKLLQSPTKATAAGCLHDQIVFWFQSGPDPYSCPEGINWNDAELIEIADRHGIDRDHILTK